METHSTDRKNTCTYTDTQAYRIGTGTDSQDSLQIGTKSNIKDTERTEDTGRMKRRIQILLFVK